MTDNPPTGKVQTVLGPIEDSDMGITLPHEHLLCDLSRVLAEPVQEAEKKRMHEKVGMSNLSWLRYHPFQNLDNVLLLDEQEAIDEANLFKHAGGGCIVDCSINGIGRDPEGLARISRSTGLHVIMGSGYYTAVSHDPRMSARSEQAIVEEIVRDVTVGVEDSVIRAGFIGEIGCSWPLEANERKVLRAAARAQQLTGACLSIHPGRNRRAPFEIIDIVTEAGADLRRTIMCHIDVRLRDKADRLRLAETGCYLEYDVFGWEGHFPCTWTTDDFLDIPNDTQRIYEICELIDAGFLTQVLISQDVCRKTARACYGGWGYAHILKYVVPMMRQRGITQQQIDTMLIDNPQRLFRFS